MSASDAIYRQKLKNEVKIFDHFSIDQKEARFEGKIFSFLKVLCSRFNGDSKSHLIRSLGAFHPKILRQQFFSVFGRHFEKTPYLRRLRALLEAIEPSYRPL